MEEGGKGTVEDSGARHLSGGPAQLPLEPPLQMMTVRLFHATRIIVLSNTYREGQKHNKAANFQIHHTDHVRDRHGPSISSQGNVMGLFSAGTESTGLENAGPDQVRGLALHLNYV